MQARKLVFLLFGMGFAAIGCGEETATKPMSSSEDDAGATPRTNDAGSKGERDRVLALFDTAVTDEFSGVALVRYQGEVLLHAASGDASREDDIPNRPDTVFDIGSLTKQFTAAAVLRLVEQGELNLTDTLGDLFDTVSEDKSPITLHQLLVHTAGFPPALGDDEEPIERDAYLERAFTTDLYYEPGSVHSYSNVGYSILAAIIELRTERSYEQFLRSELFEPADMQDTGYLLPNWDEQNVATGRGEDGSDPPLERAHAEDGPYWNLRGNGGLLSTAEDLLRWHDALSAFRVLNRAPVELMETAHVDEGLGIGFYGYGWAVEETSAGKLVWHDGGNDFFLAEMLRYVDADLQIITLSNEEGTATPDLGRQLAEAVLPELSEDELEWEPYFERELSFQNETALIVETARVEPGERHFAGIFVFAEEGTVAWRVLDPNGRPFISDRVEPGQLRERDFRIGETAGTWTFEVELSDTTGELYMAWARVIDE